MSGLYNALFGHNPMAAVLLAVLDIDPKAIPRFRDCFLDVSEEKPRIVIYTRTGGGNRDYYESRERRAALEWVDDASVGAPYNSDLQAHPQYIKDEDDSIDVTYALFYFHVPDREGLAQFLVQMRDDLVAAGSDQRSPAERFKATIEALQKGEVTPDTKRAEEAARPLLEQIEKMLKS